MAPLRAIIRWFRARWYSNAVTRNRKEFAAFAERRLRCECCGEEGEHHGCTLIPGRVVCRRCISVWYDSGLTNPAEIAAESMRWKSDPTHWYNAGRWTS